MNCIKNRNKKDVKCEWSNGGPLTAPNTIPSHNEHSIHTKLVIGCDLFNKAMINSLFQQNMRIQIADSHSQSRQTKQTPQELQKKKHQNEIGIKKKNRQKSDTNSRLHAQ